MFTWSRLEIWLAVVLAVLIVVGGTGHLLLAHKQGQRPIVVEARGGAHVPSAVNVQAHDTEQEGRAMPGDERAGADGQAAKDPFAADDDVGAEQHGTTAGDDDTGRADPDTIAVEQEGSVVAVDLININTAQPSELQRLPGIGPALAARIVAYREAWGPFGAIEDILEVSGIGPVKFANMQHMLTVD